MQSGPRWLATMPESASSRRRFAAEAACPGCGRSACRSAAKTRSVPSWPSTLIAAAMSAALSSIRRSAIASTSMPSMPSVPLISASPSLASSSTGREAGLGAARRRRVDVRRAASLTSPSPISASAQCDSGARSPEQPSEPYSCTTGVMPWREHRGHRLRGVRPDAGVPGGQRGEPQQHQRADHLALDLGAAAGGVRADQRLLQLGAHLGRDVPGGQGAEPGRDAVRRGGRGGELLDGQPGLLDGRHGVRGAARRRRRRGPPRRRRRRTAGRRPRSRLVMAPIPLALAPAPSPEPTRPAELSRIRDYACRSHGTGAGRDPGAAGAALPRRASPTR